ncbi:hypothetical protein HDU87_004338 [Geranomyces variabilis]|uniref:Multicopper oxidase n=1 Tax=Geranomyces variabilis TaxID=109894 RepID=A0AAD5TIJ6_9FUNG|nr:hypothetical protein HDU87_004338 [Geranomyces variabilis]
MRSSLAAFGALLLSTLATAAPSGVYGPHIDKRFHLTVEEKNLAPDGYTRPVFTFNGKFQGEPLILDEDDVVSITVQNKASVPFTEHWHGFLQEDTPEMDGAMGVNQWGIYPGESYTYVFQVKGQYGAYWHHSHQRQYSGDGLRGAIYIRPKKTRSKPWSLISTDPKEIAMLEQAEQNPEILMLTDHYHQTTTELLITLKTTGLPPGCMDSLLINGQGRQYCVPQDTWPSYASFAQQMLAQRYNFTTYTTKGCIALTTPNPGYDSHQILDKVPCQNTTTPLHVVNVAHQVAKGQSWLNVQGIISGTGWWYGLSIDSHPFYIVAVDGDYVIPQQVDFAQLSLGSRVSIMIKLNPAFKGRRFPFRLTGTAPLQVLEGYGFLSYAAADGQLLNLTQDEGFAYLTTKRADTGPMVKWNGDLLDTKVALNESNTTPFQVRWPIPQHSDQTLDIFAHEPGENTWSVDRQPLNTEELSDGEPIIFHPYNISATMPYEVIKNGTIVDVIIQSSLHSRDGGLNPHHPMHLHGHKFFVIGSGDGVFPYRTVREAQAGGMHFNLDSAPLRDVTDVPGGGWVILRYQVTHAGLNLLHCHTDDHTVEGMQTLLVEAPELLPAFKPSVSRRPAGYYPVGTDPLGKLLNMAFENERKENNYTLPANSTSLHPSRK